MRFITRSLFIIFGVLFGCAFIELVFALILQPPKLLFTGRLPSDFTVDPIIGFTPKLATGNYGENGVRNTSTRHKEQPIVVHLGDSVTARGKIFDHYRSCGASEFTHYNMGVESYDTFQEVEYFLRFSEQIRPKALILYFHLNDFMVTPMALLDETGKALAFAPGVPAIEFNPWLIKHSVLYRTYVGLKFPIFGKENSIEVVKTSLEKLKDHCKSRNIDLNLVILPIFSKFDLWEKEYINYHKHILEIAEQLNLKTIDLLPILQNSPLSNQALRESADDTWHPSDAFGAELAKYLCENLKLH